MVLSLVSLGAVWPAHPADVGVPGSPVLESADFATRVLRDPWDMSQYSDVSQFLNESGQQSLVSNPAVADGLFAGQSVGNIGNGPTAHFYPLFPGYANSMPVGKIGQRYPIDSATYHCLYIAMQVDSHAANSFGPDQFLLFWFGDNRLNGSGADVQWGGSAGVTLYPEAGSSTPAPGYRLYKVDLSTVGHTAGNTDWSARPTWQGLRIDPTINAGINFAIDWVRLTDCAPNSQNFTWTPNSLVKALWLELAGTTRFIRVANGLVGSSGAGSVDLQGVPPGSYSVGVGDNTTCCFEASTQSLVINQTPIVEFVSPSFHSGPDYASQAGVPWDFDSPDDINRAANMSYAISGGVLDMTTPSGPLPGGTDAQFYLRRPGPLSGAAFRYLSFRLLTEWKQPWQNTPDGMIARLIWIVPGGSGAPDSRCYATSQAIPLDVGWHTYWVDLSDAFNGSPVGLAGDCPGSLSWTTSSAILDLRFDPNENITVVANPPGGGGPFHQQLDWVRLTDVDRVTHGTPYAIQLSANRDVSQLSYYYTTDLQHPTQTPAQQYTPQQASGPFFVFLPLVDHNGAAPDTLGGLPVATNSFLWDTSSVAPNVYYICVAATGGGNSATYCSETPVVVD
jgi:hypothetical protein